MKTMSNCQWDQESDVFCHIRLLFSTIHKRRWWMIWRDKPSLLWPDWHWWEDVGWVVKGEDSSSLRVKEPTLPRYPRRDCVTCREESEVVMSSSLSAKHSTHTRSRERLTSGDPLSASYIADRAVVRGFYQRCLWNLRVAEQAALLKR